jgi:hypothetical protein
MIQNILATAEACPQYAGGRGCGVRIGENMTYRSEYGSPDQRALPDLSATHRSAIREAFVEDRCSDKQQTALFLRNKETKKW